MGIVQTIRISGAEFKRSKPLPLGANQIQIWQANLDTLQPGQDLLSPDERERALSFRFPVHRSRYATGRQLLRLLLGAYLDIPPAEIVFSYSTAGKPFLAEPPGQANLRFNLSHCEHVALFAFVREREVGVDVERIRHDLDLNEIADRFFSLGERKALAEVPPELQHEAFFHCWTRKEAFLKAKGNGLSLPLDQFDVSVLLHSPTLLVGTRPDAEERLRWSMWSVDAGPGYAAAVSVEGSGLYF